MGLAAEAVETVEDVVGRVKRWIPEVADAEGVLDRGRVRNAAGVNGPGEPVVIQGRVGDPPDYPHGSDRIRLPALALAGDRGWVGASLPRCL